MARLSKKPIQIPEGVTVEKSGDIILFKGPKGENSLRILQFTVVDVDSQAVKVRPADENQRQSRLNAGTMWSLIKNSIVGVNTGFSKQLLIEGIGYRALMEGKDIVLHLGYTNPVRLTPHEKVDVSVDKNTITVSGVDKELVHRMAAAIRALKRPEPYKGKGIRYKDEVIRRKVGKKATAAA